MAAYKLNKTQFVTFIEYTWNTRLDEWHTSLMDCILNHEFSRRFSEGWDYCSSTIHLDFVANCSYEFRWCYTTTSGTELSLKMSSYLEDDTFEVYIPEDRDHPGRVAHNDMRAVLAGHKFFTWMELKEKETAEAVAAADFFDSLR